MVHEIALNNLAHSKARTLVALSGVCFAVTLLFMQLGFWNSIQVTANLVYERLDFDLLLTSRRYVMLDQTGTFPKTRLSQAEAHPAVAAARPVYVGRQPWDNVKDDPREDTRRVVVVLGFQPTDTVSQSSQFQDQLPSLAVPDTLLIDDQTRREIWNGDLGKRVKIGSRKLQPLGTFTMGPGFDLGLIAVSDQTFSRLFSDHPLDDVSLGLIQLEPGSKADARQVARDLRERLPADVLVLTRQQALAKEQRYWAQTTSTGIIFGCGVMVAILFGIVITHQVLALEVTQHLPEYAALKALGFRDRYVAAIVLQQAVIFAVVGYVPGLLFAWGIYLVGEKMTYLPIPMRWDRAVIVFVLNLTMCCLSGWFALRVLRRADLVELVYP